MATLADGIRSAAHQRPVGTRDEAGTRSAAHQRQVGTRSSLSTGRVTARHPSASQPPQPNAGIVLIGPVGGARG